MNMKRLGVGIVGSGFVARLRAELFLQNSQVDLIGIAGHPDRIKDLCQEMACASFTQADDLIKKEEVDLIVVANTNADHAKTVRLALEAGKHVVVEYPLALHWQEGQELWELAQSQQKMLHIEHIELLGGVHQTLVRHLPQIGIVQYVRYVTKNPQATAPDKWTYHPDRFGFPLIAALSRIHRLTAVWGEVKNISCQLHYSGNNLPDRFTYCVCQSQLKFNSGLLADIHYSKGEYCWQSERSMEVHGTEGGLFFNGDAGTIVTAHGEKPLEVGSSRGLFKIDTEQVIAHLLQGKKLYIYPLSSLHALRVACAAQKSTEIGQVVELDR